jgi:hypothetical protein
LAWNIQTSPRFNASLVAGSFFQQNCDTLMKTELTFIQLTSFIDFGHIFCINGRNMSRHSSFSNKKHVFDNHWWIKRNVLKQQYVVVKYVLAWIIVNITFNV